MRHSDVNWPRLIDFLRQQLGKPYVFGKENRRDEDDWEKYIAWDCSELVEVGFAKIGISLPDGSYNQAKVVNRLPEGEAPLVGDLGFKWDPETQAVHHVGIYVGEGYVIEAKGKRWGVVATKIEDYVRSSHFAFWGRLKTVTDA